MADEPAGPIEPAAAGVGIGSRLRAARERAGFTVIEAAERLHMEPRMVEALDNETFGVLGAPVYARGHLRRYAELVGEGAAELQQLYAANFAPSAAPDLRQVPHRDRSPAARSLAAPVAAGLVIMAAIGVVAWMFRSVRPLAPLQAAGDGAKPATGAATAATAATEVAAASAPSAGSAALAVPAVPVTVPVPSPAAEPAKAVVATPVLARAPVAVESDARAVPLELQLRFATDSWAEVYDGDGHRLYYDLAPANTEQTLAGKAPFRVVLGHAPGVSVSINGRSASIPEAALRSDVADFVVNAAGRLATSR